MPRKESISAPQARPRRQGFGATRQSPVIVGGMREASARLPTGGKRASGLQCPTEQEVPHRPPPALGPRGACKRNGPDDPGRSLVLDQLKRRSGTAAIALVDRVDPAAGGAARALILDLHLGPAKAVLHLLGAVAVRLADHHFLGDAGILGDNGLLAALLDLERAFAEGIGRARDGAVRRPALESHALLAKTHILFDGPLHDIAADADAALVHLALADVKPLFRDRDDLLVAGIQVAILAQHRVAAGSGRSLVVETIRRAGASHPARRPRGAGGAPAGQPARPCSVSKPAVRDSGAPEIAAVPHAARAARGTHTARSAGRPG